MMIEVDTGHVCHEYPNLERYPDHRVLVNVHRSLAEGGHVPNQTRAGGRPSSSYEEEVLQEVADDPSISVTVLLSDPSNRLRYSKKYANLCLSKLPANDGKRIPDLYFPAFLFDAKRRFLRPISQRQRFLLDNNLPSSTEFSERLISCLTGFFTKQITEKQKQKRSRARASKHLE
ncbi:hypothetical protein EVAR_53607_1 [Eumeta japonica]|uniref:Uncharacterized protein n=1 Tax=Eumeta variegata TaxID=151549 RepID=A0A4C1WY99_EUMVA|nr:hypothetical protein EVAR_53607_1 [Eumeta japonica]